MAHGTGTQEGTEPKSLAMYDATRKRRKAKRVHRESHEGEISELNITPMLDMMTILLVFLLKSMSVSSSNINVENLVLPHSTTELRVEEALSLMVTKEAILVDQKVVTRLVGGSNIDPADLPEGPSGFLIKPLYDALDGHKDRLKKIADFGGSGFEGRVAVIADKTLPYGVLFRILYTCGRAEFGRFKLFVQKPT